MRQMASIAVVCVLVFFSACSSKKNNADEAKSGEEVKVEKSDDKGGGASEETTSNRWQERRAKGDTLALPYKELQSYLPEISGYTKEGGPKGSQMNMPGMGSWSEAEQNYVNGENRVSVKIMDYNAAYQAFQGMTMAFGMAFSAEDDEKKQEKVDLGEKDVAAYGTIYKKDKKAELIVVAGERFLISVDSNGDNDESFIKSVAKSISLSKLAGL